ncbi:MAG: outer membrane beta-barrel protein [Bacteroidales bacterium]|nr:outer membrane beta-barrel protein [Bacteroidales bacterium]
MVKYDSHIDVLFRDGLSKMEVLPPESVWENISPTVRKSSRMDLWLKIAAGLAVLVSMGLMAYFYRNITGSVGGEQVASATDNNMPAFFNDASSNITADETDNAAADKTAPVTMEEDAESESGSADSDLFPRMIVNYMDIDLPYDRPDQNMLRSTDSPEEVKPRNNVSEILITDIMPVEPLTEPKQKRWKLGAEVSPTYLSSNLKTANEAISQINDNENAVLSYTGGFNISYRVNKRLSIRSGIYYSSLGRDVKGVRSYSGFQPFAGAKSAVVFGVRTSSGTVNSTNGNIFLTDVAGNRIDGYYSVDNFDPLKSNLIPFGDQLRQNFEYIEIPVLVSYRVIDRKLNFNVLGGMSYNFLIGNQTWAINKTGAKVLLGSTEGVDQLLLSSSLGMSMEYELNDRLLLNLEPQVRYYLNTGGELGAGNPYTFGIFSGMHFRF